MRKIISILLIIGGVGVIMDGEFKSGIMAIILGIILLPKDMLKGQSAPQPTQYQGSSRNYSSHRKEYKNLINRTETLILPFNYVVVDFETTGLNADYEKIIEVGAAKVINGQTVATFNQLVNPEKNITKRITEITGLTNADVYGAPTEINVIPDLVRFAEGYTLVAHSAGFDMKFLAAAMERCGINGYLEYIDTIQLARKRFPGRSSYKLADLIEDYGLAPGPQTHRALDDVLATKNLYELIRTGRF